MILIMVALILLNRKSTIHVNLINPVYKKYDNYSKTYYNSTSDPICIVSSFTSDPFCLPINFQTVCTLISFETENNNHV